jgi:hypothetical protein
MLTSCWRVAPYVLLIKLFLLLYWAKLGVCVFIWQWYLFPVSGLIIHHVIALLLTVEFTFAAYMFWPDKVCLSLPHCRISIHTILSLITVVASLIVTQPNLACNFIKKLMNKQVALDGSISHSTITLACISLRLHRATIYISWELKLLIRTKISVS